MPSSAARTTPACGAARPNTWEDDLPLPPGGPWDDTYAYSIWSDQTTLYIAGESYSGAAGQYAALLSTRPLAPLCGWADFNGDGDVGIDLDIEAFFACIAGIAARRAARRLQR